MALLIVGIPLIDIIFPSPILAKLGRSSPLTIWAILESVLLPKSPYISASGSSPTPTPSKIIIKKLFTYNLLFINNKKMLLVNIADGIAAFFQSFLECQVGIINYHISTTFIGR